MQPAASGKGYFLRQSGRITGPYSMLKLTAMYRRGELKCEDMCSEDKIRWNYINVLFPDLSPTAPIAVDEPAAAPDPEVVPKLPAQKQESLPPAGEVRPSPRQPADEVIPPSHRQPPAKDRRQDVPQPAYPEWLADIARTIALIWDFREILQMHSRKAGRFLGIAFGIHVLLGVVIVLTFGKYYSSRFDSFFSPLMGVSLLTILLGVACVIGWFAARGSVTDGAESPPDWKICAAGFCVNYGILACCVMALAHGRKYWWVQALLVFIDSCILCSCAMQLRDFLERNGRNWRLPAACTMVFLNLALAAVIYGFVTLI